MSVTISFILAYPLGLTNNIIESFLEPNPFQVHIDTLFPIYIFTCASLFFFSRKKESFHEKYKNQDRKFPILILTIFALAVFMRLEGSDLQNINQDEQELSLYSYHLVDGILVGRQAFFMSTTVHSPLGFYVSYIIYQLLSPFDYYGMTELMLRSPMLVFGILEICVFLLFANKLKFNKTLIAIGMTLLAVNSYAIFGSRLMIPQDSSVFAFFILIFSYFFLKALEKKDKCSGLEIFLLGLLFAATFLVKMAALFMIPLVLIFWFAKKKSFKDFVKITAVSLFFFSPVLLFNIISYKLTGYTDVPTAKILNFIGVNANSIMGNMDIYGAELQPFFQTMGGFLEMLADQWTLIFTLVLGFSIGFLMFRKNELKQNSTILYLLALFAITILFFSINGYRAYYAEYLTVPAVLLSIYTFRNLPKYFTAITFTIVAIYSAYYSYNTHIGVTPRPDTLQVGEYGRFDLYSFEEFSLHRSLASWSFLRDDGFPALRTYLESNPGLLIIEDSFLNGYLHHFRYYIGIHRDVTAHYLGESERNERPFIYLSDYDAKSDGIVILEYAEEKVMDGDVLLYNHNERPKIIIRNLETK